MSEAVTINQGVTYADRIIGMFEPPKWGVREFLVSKKNLTLPPTELINNKVIEGVEIPKRYSVSQNHDSSFNEFANDNVSGFSSEVMRKNGCGITALYMVLSTLTNGKIQSKFPTVGTFAMRVLSEHRNDLVLAGKVIKKGTPVYSKNGWYHDALIYGAKSLANINGYRLEGIDIVDFALEYSKKALDGKNVLALISVNSDLWFLPNPQKDVETSHLLVVNGIKFENDTLSEIRITDPYSKTSEDAVSKWVKCDRRIKNAFLGKAMFFYNNA